MDISVIIPTRPNDDGTVARCVASVRPQLGPGDELFVSADGEIDPGAFRDLGDARVLSGPRGGPGGARNRALDIAGKALILFLNDDVIAHDGLIDTHRAAHSRRTERGQAGAMVLGSAPWHVFEDDRVIDRLLRETSMIFFYDRMDTDNPERDWGYRHAWTLNLSVPASIVGRFSEHLRQPMFDDLEWAYRLQRSHRAPLIYRPDAAVTHRHRYEPIMLLRREALLGHQAAALMRANEACGRDVFGDRFACDRRAGIHEDHITGGIVAAREALHGLCARADLPAGSVSADEVATMLEESRVWREVARSIGFVHALRGESPEAAQQYATEELSVSCERSH